MIDLERYFGFLDRLFLSSVTVDSKDGRFLVRSGERLLFSLQPSLCGVYNVVADIPGQGMLGLEISAADGRLLYRLAVERYNQPRTALHQTSSELMFHFMGISNQNQF